MCATSSQPDNKALIRQYVEDVVNADRLATLDDLIGAGYVFHCPDGDLYGPDGARLNLAEMRRAFPDLQMELEDVVAEDDRVSRRFILRGTHLGPFLGLPPTGEPVAISGMAIDRVDGGQIVETWISLSVIDLVRGRQPNAESG